MTRSTTTVRRGTREARDVVARHPGCYWNWERAAWVAWATVPQPRPPREQRSRSLRRP